MIPNNEAQLKELVAGLSPAEIEVLVDSLSPIMAQALIEELGPAGGTAHRPSSPVEQAVALYENFRVREHTQYLSDRLVGAVRDVENGISRKLIIELPPRTGKSVLATMVTPAWIRSMHPAWDIALVSHDSKLSTSWGRQIRRWVETGDLGPHLKVSHDAGAVSEWEVEDGGKMLAISTRESFTGRGAKVLVIDDPHKDFVDAHSLALRKALWDWWLSVAQLRLEPPYLVVVCMTRWHTDDLVGRLLSTDYEGDPAEWEEIRIPGIAKENDPLGRPIGTPLLSPLIDETEEEALKRWNEVSTSVGSYVFEGMIQQNPVQSKGNIFNADWFRYWTTNPANATADGRVRYLDPHDLASGAWLDSWDLSFKGLATSDFVVGQRWVRSGPDRYLITQKMDKWDFPEVLEQFKDWSLPSSPYGQYVHKRLVEDKANGSAMIAVVKRTISGIKPINPTDSKEMRYRAVTPECESSNVYLPFPDDPGNSWVPGLVAELRTVPAATHDDQADAFAQALIELRTTEVGTGKISNPNKMPVMQGRQPNLGRQIIRDRAAAALTDNNRSLRGYRPR